MNKLFKNTLTVASAVGIAATGTVAFAVCSPDTNSSSQSTSSSESVTKLVPSDEASTDCMASNLDAKAKYWSDVLAGRNTVANLSVQEREAQVAADMENAAANLRDGTYRVCWGE